jgi:outer membrane protein TolC
MAMIWQVEAAAHRVGAAKADFYPSIDLIAFAGLDTIFFRKLFRWESRSAYIIPGLHLPIFTAGRIRANVRARQAEFEELIYSYNELVLRAAQEVADQIVVLKAADLELQDQIALVENQSQTLCLTSLKVDHALSNCLDYLRAKELLLQEQLALNQKSYARTAASIALIRALGGGYGS